DASYLLLNKSDLMSPLQVEESMALLTAAYPQADMISASSASGEGVSGWLDLIMGSTESYETSLDMDYDLYAEGEAQLGWMNAAFAAEGSILDVAEMCTKLVERMSAKLKA